MDIARASQAPRTHPGTRFSSTRRAVEQLDGRRVLVTGASGFIGGRVCERLAAAGVDVTGTSRSKPTGNQGVRWLPVDLGDAAATREAVRTARPDVIMHLAGAVWGSPDSSLLERTIEANLMGTVNVLTAAQHESTSRVIVTGTMMEPDFSDAKGIANSPYAASKWASSIYARMFHALYDLPVVILRLFMVYGPGDSDDRSSSRMSSTRCSAEEGRSCPAAAGRSTGSMSRTRSMPISAPVRPTAPRAIPSTSAAARSSRSGTPSRRLPD